MARSRRTTGLALSDAPLAGSRTDHKGRLQFPMLKDRAIGLRPEGNQHHDFLIRLSILPRPLPPPQPDQLTLSSRFPCPAHFVSRRIPSLPLAALCPVVHPNREGPSSGRVDYKTRPDDRGAGQRVHTARSPSERRHLILTVSKIPTLDPFTPVSIPESDVSDHTPIRPEVLSVLVRPHFSPCLATVEAQTSRSFSPV